MTPEQTEELEDLKAALKQHITEAEKARLNRVDVGPFFTEQQKADAVFDNRAQTMSPLACRIALAAIRALEEIASEDEAQGYVADLGADCDLNLILSIWKGGNP